VPVSTRRYTELKLSISDYLQRRNWVNLFELCGTTDDEIAKTIAVIFTQYEPKNVWRFLDNVRTMSVQARREKRDSVATCCYIIGKMGQSNTAKSLSSLREFLLNDHMLRAPITQALSNIWVLDTKKTAAVVMKSWVLSSEDNDDLQEVGIRSCQYLAERAPEMVATFLFRVASLKKRKAAMKAAEEMIASSRYLNSSRERKTAQKTVRKEK
jgi:hypothetical protein